MNNKDLIKLNNINRYKFNIKEIKNLSDGSTKRMRIYFNNGYGISIVRGIFSYGGDLGLFEIAPLDKDGDLNGDILNLQYDDVEGYLTLKEVFERIKHISELK